jgi:hypothetical protein
VSSFTVNYDYRRVTQLGFKSSAEFREAFLNAEVVEKQWVIKKHSTKTPKKKI